MGFGCIYLFCALICNCIIWFIYFKWYNEYFTLFWTDSIENIQYYYHWNVFGWAFQIKKLANDKFVSNHL